MSELLNIEEKYTQPHSMWIEFYDAKLSRCLNNMRPVNLETTDPYQTLLLSSALDSSIKSLHHRVKHIKEKHCE